MQEMMFLSQVLVVFCECWVKLILWTVKSKESNTDWTKLNKNTVLASYFESLATD